MLREKWRLAQKAHNHLKNVAAQTVTYPAHHSPIPTKRPDKPLGDEGSNVNFDQGLSYLPEDFSDLNNQISSTLLSEFIDPTCGGSFL